ncbi:MAG: exopolyphosphatase [Clostridium cadaveris]|uniref:Exopolyphosphatase n=1 Tax=Clostridium cadaveris TaxID=1529 RepID=A0A316MCA8_9CLOT|nr:ParM/StbA family protein [Clostridium sp.]PWL55438.1 MAG: exopolyphosphatase [Clostridium cadaveris]
MITVLDLGNNNIKGITDTTGPMTFRSNLSRDYEAYPDGFSYVLLDGQYTYFEKGTFSKEYIKTNKDYKAQLLYGIAKLTDMDHVETNLALLLPISEMEHKAKYESELKNKQFKFTVKTTRRKDMTINIKDVFVVPEGYASYFVLDDKEKAGNILVIDIGGRTTNVVAMDYGKPQTLNTYKIGILDFYQKLKNLNDDKQYKIEDIEKAIQRGDIKVSQKDLASFMNDVINEISLAVNINQYNVRFTGGGAVVLKDIITNVLPKQCTILDNPLYSNVNGALIVSKQIWGKSNG